MRNIFQEKEDHEKYLAGSWIPNHPLQGPVCPWESTLVRVTVRLLNKVQLSSILGKLFYEKLKRRPKNLVTFF